MSPQEESRIVLRMAARYGYHFGLLLMAPVVFAGLWWISALWFAAVVAVSMLALFAASTWSLAGDPEFRAGALRAHAAWPLMEAVGQRLDAIRGRTGLGKGWKDRLARLDGVSGIVWEGLVFPADPDSGARMRDWLERLRDALGTIAAAPGGEDEHGGALDRLLDELPGIPAGLPGAGAGTGAGTGDAPRIQSSGGGGAEGS